MLNVGLVVEGDGARLLVRTPGRLFRELEYLEDGHPLCDGRGGVVGCALPQLDYGFGKSSASVHLHVRTQDGKIKTVGEFVAPHLPAYEFASEVCRRLVAPKTQGQ